MKKRKGDRIIVGEKDESSKAMGKEIEKGKMNERKEERKKKVKEERRNKENKLAT
jgi:hypothetical protein